MWAMADGAIRGASANFVSLVRFAPKPKRHHAIRDLTGLPESLGRLGALEIRLALTKKDIRKVQRLRYKVFFEDGAAKASRSAALVRRDLCPFDRVCDHLLVIDHAHRNRFGRPKPKVVGTYRLLRQDVADKNFGFYSADEFDIEPMLSRHQGQRFLELGRSCVLPDYRGKRTLELLWRGIWAYVKHHRIDAMFGGASFESIQPAKLSLPLSFLHHHAIAAGEWATRPHPHRRAPIDVLDPASVDARRAIASLPPLIKGYLRVGAKFGSGAVVDRAFGTTDVFVIMPVADIEQRYIEHFGGADAALSRAA